jgi:two-component system response regulator FlrC
VNCAALPEELAESLLFGHLKGSFTGATRDTEGFFRQAHRGTLFLDEIGELTPQLQAKLLRAIQEKEVLPVGSSDSQKVDVRIVSATNRNLRDPRFNNGFREDLYFRISTFRINVPSLSSRLDDVLPLANFFVLKHSPETSSIQFAPEAIAKLLAYQWPGNVRELENVVQRAIVLCNGIEVQSKHLIFDEPIAGYSLADGEFSSDNALFANSPSEVQHPHRVEEPLQDALEANEFRIIAETVKAAPTKQAAAKQLGISERTLRYKMAKMRERGFAPQRKIA